MSLGLELCKERFLDNVRFKLDTWRGAHEVTTPKRLKQYQAAVRAIKKDGLALIESHSPGTNPRGNHRVWRPQS